MRAQIDPRSTVGQLVAEQPSRSRVFEALRIDYCCGGKKPLEQACRERNLVTETVVDLLIVMDSRDDDESCGGPADDMSLTELADHIEQTHHAELRIELPRLGRLVEKVRDAHADTEPRLHRVFEAFSALRDELSSHMVKEERVLFPMIRRMELATEPKRFEGGSLAGPIRQMEAEHDDAGAALEVLREATDGFTPPEGACNSWRAMLDGLAWLERDMHRHVHKENSILFPKALDLEASLRNERIS
ncbi:MAG: iron-sulfur cluster repair di-iron protein [Phycisphaerales bacterium]|nr:MAG: iron-sulfur cluster repair di-iron protein [Phycisphaerales bacterium]